MDDGTDKMARAQDAESHFATFVKFDLVDSTHIWRKLSRPDGLELLRGFRAAVDSVLKSYSVRIEWEGDGALVAFGYPEVRVDAAEAAVRTSLRLIEAVHAVSAVPSVRLDLRVGIASGPVTVDLATGAFESVSIKRAERLKTAAPPGGIVVAEDTRRLVRDFFEYEDLGTVPLKGFEEGIHGWLILRETAVVSRFAAQRLGAGGSAIVGRADALARLSAAWGGALEGHGAAVCLVGDAGMGKSRLARAALEQASLEGAVVLEIDCTPSTGNSPLLPIGVLLRRTAHIGPGATDGEKQVAALGLLTRLLGESEAREALSYLAPLFGIESAVIPLERTREQVRDATIVTIVAIVRALAAQSPLALLCEDLHWADDTTARVTQSVAQIIGELPALMIVTRWPKPVTSIDFDDITSTFETIPVEPLTASNAADLVRAVAGAGMSPAGVDVIVNRCGGVPLLLEEVTRSTLEHADHGATLGAATASDSSVPPELQLVVESRLERWPGLKGIIEAASVLGREFPVRLLEDMVPGQREEVSGALALFADHGLFAPSAGRDRASFRHALIRDAVYETLVSRDYLRRLHSRAADTLLAQYLGTLDASPDVLAQHLCLARRLDEAIGIRLAAGEDTFKRGAYAEATGHCEAARELLTQVPDAPGVRAAALSLCVLRGMVGAGISGYSADPVEVAYREAREMFDESTGSDVRYPVIRGLATFYLVRGELATAYQYSLDGLTLAERSGRPDYRIDAMSVHAYATLYFGRLEDCRTWIDRCLALYEEAGGDAFRYPVPQDAKTAALAILPTVAWLLGDAAGAEAAIARGLAHVDRLDREFDKALLHAWIAGTRYTQRRYLDALQHAGIAYALGKEHRFQEWEGVGALMALLSQCALQPAPEAIAQASGVCQQFKAKGVGLNAPYFFWGIARGLLNTADTEGARQLLAMALASGQASQDTRMNPEIWMLEAEIEADPSRAIGLLRDAYDLAERQGAVANAVRAASLCVVRLYNTGSDVDWAQETLSRLDGRTTPGETASSWMLDGLAHARVLMARLR